MTAREVVLELVDEHVDVADPWAGRKSLRERARGNSCPIDVDEFDEAFNELHQDVEIVTWHGKVTLATEELVMAALEAEAESDGGRTLLAKRLNGVLRGTYEPVPMGSSEQVGLPPEDEEAP